MHSCFSLFGNEVIWSQPRHLMGRRNYPVQLHPLPTHLKVALQCLRLYDVCEYFVLKVKYILSWKFDKTDSLIRK